MIRLIVACDEAGGIGLKGDLPWPRMRADQHRFWRLTTGGTVVIGRKAFETVGELPDRKTIVLSRSAMPGVETAADSTDIVAYAQTQDVWVIGGQEVYQVFLPYARELYLTRIHATFPTDTYFNFDASEWRLLEQERHSKDEQNPFDYTFYTYVR